MPNGATREPSGTKFNPVVFDRLTGRYRVNLRIGSTTIPLGDFSKADEAQWSYRQARRAMTEAWSHQMTLAREEAERKLERKLRRKKHRV